MHLANICKIKNFLGDDAQSDGILRQSRGGALSVALKESAELLWNDLYRDKLLSTLLNQLTADKVPVTLTAVRSCGYLLQYLLLNDQALPINLLGPFVKVSIFHIFQNLPYFSLL